MYKLRTYNDLYKQLKIICSYIRSKLQTQFRWGWINFSPKICEVLWLNRKGSTLYILLVSHMLANDGYNSLKQ
jgi:hypothetical protein